MRRMVGVALCVFLANSVNAAESLKVLSPYDETEQPAPGAAEKYKKYQEEQAAAARVPSAEVANFLKRLKATVSTGINRSQTGAMTGLEARNQAIALNKLQSESERFGVIFAPFHKCRVAATDAAFSWQGFIGNDENQFNNYYNSYLEAADECSDSIKRAKTKAG